MSILSKSFPCVVSKNTRILILGTMPGKLSLHHQQYYAHPRNNFWKIIYGLYGLNVEQDYEKKLSFLASKGFGLWDTLQHCEREGSLDSNIKNEQSNNFKELFKRYPAIKFIAFNGKSAYNYFKKHIGLETGHSYFILPSTSPANAGKNFESKLKDWKKVLLETDCYSK